MRALLIIVSLALASPATALADPGLHRLFDALWTTAIAGHGCDPALKGTDLLVFDTDAMGARTLSSGVIEIDRGLVDFFAVIAASRSKEGRDAARTLFKVILDKAEDELFALRSSDHWARVEALDPDRLAVGRDSRVAFTLAHEIAHLCLNHPLSADFTSRGQAVRNERAADRWALEVLHGGVAGVDLDFASAAAALVELAMLDGPTLTGGEPHRHPVRMARFSMAHRTVRTLTRDRSAPYFFEAQAMLTCILDKGPEQALERFRQWVDNDLVCYFEDEVYAARLRERGWCHETPRAVTPELVGAAMPSPWSVCERRTRLVLASAGAQPMALLRRASDTPFAARVMGEGWQGAKGSGLGAWVDEGESYRLAVKANDDVVVMADGAVLGRISVDARGAVAIDSKSPALTTTDSGEILLTLPRLQGSPTP